MYILYVISRNDVVFFFFNDTATTEIYSLSLHDALPISLHLLPGTRVSRERHQPVTELRDPEPLGDGLRSEEHTSELQSPCNLVCRLLLEKKKIHAHWKISQRCFIPFTPTRRRFGTLDI